MKILCPVCGGTGGHPFTVCATCHGKGSVDDSMPEPRVAINGVPLSEAQAMAVRAAITTFHAQLTPSYRALLGPIGELYHARLTEVLTIIIASTP